MKMYRKSKTTTISKAFNFLVLALILSACIRNEKPSSTDPAVEFNNLAELPDSVEILFLIPSPGEMLDRIYDSEIDYNIDFINPVSNKEKYLGSYKQALNLGVYFSDMAYLTLFDTRVTETVDYLEAIQYLSYEVGISSSVFGSLIERAKANLGNMDSLFTISNEAYVDLLDFLESGGKENTITMISSGAFIESLYLAVNAAGEYSGDNEITSLIWELRFPLDNLIERAKYSSDDENVQKILEMLIPVNEIFNNMKKTSPGLKVTTEGSKKVKVDVGANPKVTEEGFNNLKNWVTTVRTSIISGE
jgi:hypothetical protein